MTQKCDVLDQPWLCELLAPVTPDEFFTDYWEREPLHLAGSSPAKFDSVLTLNDLSCHLGTTLFRSNEFRMARRSDRIDPERFVRYDNEPDGSLLDSMNLDAVLSAFADGHTIILEAFNRRYSQIGSLCRRFEALLNCTAIANVYVTPKENQGFLAHFDTHDVFILQIHGSKLWNFHLSTDELPSKHDPRSGFAYDHLPIERTVTLKQGDLLYVPRGVVHSAAAKDEVSCHITIGVHTITWRDMLYRIVDDLASDNRVFRESISYFDERVRERQKKELTTALSEALSGEDDWSQRLEVRDLRRYPADRVRRPCGLVSLATLEQMNLETAISVTEDLVCRTTVRDDGVEIVFGNNQLGLPTSAVEAIAKLLSGTTTVGELPLPGSNEARVEFVRELVVRGLVEIQ